MQGFITFSSVTILNKYKINTLLYMFLQRLYVGRSKGTYIGGDTFYMGL